MGHPTDDDDPMTGPRRLASRLGDPLAWSAADKCLFVALIFLTFTLWYWVSWFYLLRNPDSAPYVAHDFLPTALRVQTVAVVSLACLVVAALVLRRRPAHASVLIAPTLAVCVYVLLSGAQFFGLHTSLFAGLTIIASVAVGYVLFARRHMHVAVATVVTGLAAIAVAERAGRLPYAPLFREAPFHDGVLERSFLLYLGGPTILMMVFIGLIVYFVIDRWHDREHKLEVVGEQLGRANEVISRYVASQLAEQVRNGNYSMLERHERRRLTLFFSDIEDFAAIADQMEPEDLSALLNDYLSEMTAIAERYGGTIDKFVGDAIMIFFGAPDATTDTDHALRAVRMAAEMQVRLAELRERWARQGIERPFHVRMGVNTGVVSIGAFGSHSRLEYTAIGRHVNLAARLQAQCERDCVLISHSTWVHVQDSIAAVAKGEIALRGFQQPVTAYEVRPVDGAALACSNG